MRIALPVWSDRVYTTFDFAGGITLVELNNNRVVSRNNITFENDNPLRRPAN